LDLYDTCFNDGVGYALYCYFCEINTDNFITQNFPETEAKSSSIVNRLDPVYKFIKQNYVLTNSSINKTIDELHKEYICHHGTLNRPCGKINFTDKMKEIGFTYVLKKIQGKQYNKYIIPHEALLKVANKSKWIHHTDVFETVEYDIKFEEAHKEKKTYNQLTEEIEELKQQIKDLQKPLKEEKKKRSYNITIEEDIEEERERDFKKDLIYDFGDEEVKVKPTKKSKNKIVNNTQPIIKNNNDLTDEDIKNNKKIIDSRKEIDIDLNEILNLT
jgi:hypothetical protein